MKNIFVKIIALLIIVYGIVMIFLLSCVAIEVLVEIYQASTDKTEYSDVQSQ